MRCHAFCLIAVLLMTACTDSGKTFGPTPTSVTSRLPLIPAGSSPDAIPIAFGETTTQSVTLSDPPCVAQWGGDFLETCRRFAVAAPTSGLFIVELKSPGPSGLTLQLGGLFRWGVTSIRVEGRVQAGSTYEVSVGLHDPRENRSSQTFELTTSISPL